MQGNSTFAKVVGRWVIGVAAFALVVCLVDHGEPRAARGDELANLNLTPATPDKPITVRERLIVGLQARLQSEVQFVDDVLGQVQAGHIPQSMVDETFFWSRQKAGDPKYGRPRRPIIYFKPAMIARANALHVML
jgi:hypothetical protein